MKSLLSDLIKNALAAALYYSGVCWIAMRIRLRHRMVVLMYHRVLTEQQMRSSYSADQIVVSCGTFARQMAFIRRCLTPVPPQELPEILAGRAPWPPCGCVITFDDGWADNFDNAKPVLERHRVPAAFFLATDYIGSDNCFWQEQLTAQLHAARMDPVAGHSLFAELGAEQIPFLEPAAARTQIRQLVTSLKSLPRTEIDLLMKRLDDLLGHDVRSPVDRFMSWKQVRDMQQTGLVTIGSHAHTHTPLTMLDRREVAAELERANHTLDEHLGHAARLLAYPNGNHDEITKQLAEQSGHPASFTTIPGLVAPGDAPHALKRINVSERDTRSAPRFACRLLGWF